MHHITSLLYIKFADWEPLVVYNVEYFFAHESPQKELTLRPEWEEISIEVCKYLLVTAVSVACMPYVWCYKLKANDAGRVDRGLETILSRFSPHSFQISH